MLANHIRMVEMRIDLLSTILAQSGILTKSKDIEEVIRLKDVIKIFKENLEKLDKKKTEKHQDYQKHLEKLDKNAYLS